jgi:transcriptional regulator with XRE-family HTH domain
MVFLYPKEERTMDSVHPIQAIRKKNNMTQAEFAAALQVSEPLVRLLELGAVKESPSVYNALASRGFDVKKLKAEVEAWRKAHAEEAGRKLSAGR